jgi:glycosyltransferase involved in cell wall biosynthesis
VEEQDWVIRRVGTVIMSNLRRLKPETSWQITSTCLGLHNQVVHFGSLWCFVRHLDRVNISNQMAVTVFHGREGMGSDMDRALDIFRCNIHRLDAVLTACNIMGSRMRSWGVPEDKLHIIPLGVNLECFRPPLPEQRRQERRRLSIPDDAVCIGSFQKDGVGWAEGLEPKLIKGPDVFLEVVRRLSKKYSLFVLLTGPARGYVKKGLEAAGIAYRHEYLYDYNELPEYYHCLDLYLITSREEGGPEALPECMATGVPLISTNVGMAPDMIEFGTNGFIVDVEDVDGLVRASSLVIEDSGLKKRIVSRALDMVQSYNWPYLAQAYYDKVYAPLLSSLK